MSYDYELTYNLPATPQEVYEAWLSSEGHSEMTGADAEASDVVGASFSAWDGYIEGKNSRARSQYARSFSRGARPSSLTTTPDSTITVELTPIKAGTRLKLSHRGVPDGQTSYEEHGWREFYFEPMKAYFARRKAERQL